MKIEQALVLYLLKHKEISLQGIGTFRIDAVVPETIDNDKPVIIPPDAISFIYNPKIKEEPDLIDFIVENTKKIKPLASADLDSFLTLGRQFLNIGKPFTIQNLGTLEKLKSGELSFEAGPLIQKIEAPKTKIEDEGAEKHEENLFNDYEKEMPNNNKKVLRIILIVILLGLGGWAVWNFGFKNDSKEPVETVDNAIVAIPDSSAIIRKKDSRVVLQKKADSLKKDSIKITQTNPVDSFTFKVVVMTTTDEELAEARLAKLENFGRKVIMYTTDSITYKVAHPFKLPLTDTTRVLDSLNKFYYRGKAHIEIQ